MTFLGGGFGDFDGTLGSKIDKLLAGRPSAKQKIEDFLVDEMGVDPSKIPMSFGEAKRTINEQMNLRGYNFAVFNGNSRGLATVRCDAASNDEPECPHCQSTDARAKGGNKYECYDCERDYTWVKPPQTGTTFTEQTRDKDFWSELLRVYAALVKGFHPEDEPDKNFTKFEAMTSYQEAIITGVNDPKIRWKRPERYPTGTILRVTDGTESEYVRIGGPFTDDDLIILATMKPIRNPSAWTVVEVLSE